METNALGTMNGVNQASKFARAASANVRVFVDAVHYAPHRAVDVKLFDCDFVAMSAYKFYGPHIGVLWGKRAAIEALDAPRLDPAPQESPERLETGTQNHEAIVGAAAAVDFIASLALCNQHLGATASCTRCALGRGTPSCSGNSGIHSREMVCVRLRSRTKHLRMPTLSFTLRGVRRTMRRENLARRGVFVSKGDSTQRRSPTDTASAPADSCAPGAAAPRRRKRSIADRRRAPDRGRPCVASSSGTAPRRFPLLRAPRPAATRTLTDSSTREPVTGAVVTVSDLRTLPRPRHLSVATATSTSAFPRSKLIHVVRIGYRRSTRRCRPPTSCSIFMRVIASQLATGHDVGRRGGVPATTPTARRSSSGEQARSGFLTPPSWRRTPPAKSSIALFQGRARSDAETRGG
jgi:hypothetical protein